LINISGGSDMGITEIDEVMGVIKAEADPDANIIFGMVDNEDMSEELKVTVIATGFDEEGVRLLVKHPANLKELMQKEQRQVVDRPAAFKRGREAASNATGDLFGSKVNLDLPAYLRRAAD
jgi:cell division protein FtsZ